MQEQLVGLNQACEMLGVTDVTIRTWDKEGKLKAVKTPGGHRRWRLSDLQAFQGISLPEKPDVEELIAIYGRVSSHDQKQKGDLDRQIGRLATHCNKKKYKVAHTLQDVGSGMSDSRPRLNQLFKLVETHAITKVVVEHKDRLTRFNFGVYERFFNSHGVVIECTEDKREKFCSKTCAGQAKKTSYKKKCEECGGTFETKPSHDGKFCSKDCSYRNARRTDKMKVDRIEKCCEFCGEKFSITPGAERKRIKQFGVGAKFCSPKCMGAYKSSQFDHPPVNRKCEYCGTDFTVEKPCKKNRFCSKECFYEVTKEENDKERTRIIPLMKEYRLTHTVAETAEKFGMSPSGVQQWGVLGPEAEKRASCPDQLTAEQEEVLIGNLLGDGYLKYLKPNTNQNSCLSIRQKLEFSEYLKGLYEVYSPFSCGYTEGKTKKPSRVDGKITHAVEHWNGEWSEYSHFYTVSHPVFNGYRAKWYSEPDVKNSPKIIPADIRLTWQTAAIWMCDDGSNHVNDVIKGRNHGPRYLMLHTESFSKQEVELLIDCLERDLDIKGTLNHHDGKPTIRIGGDDWYQFIENIKPHVPWDCFQYKCKNRKKVSRNKSGYVGVQFREDKGAWRSSKSFRINGVCKTFHIGYFETPEEAVEARQEWIEKSQQNLRTTEKI